jgi:hypothetical protein
VLAAIIRRARESLAASVARTADQLKAEEVIMVAHASIWLLDTGGIPAAGPASAEGMVTLGGILGMLVVVSIACLFVIGYREWRAERARAGGLPAPARGETLRRTDGAMVTRLPRLAGAR